MESCWRRRFKLAKKTPEVVSSSSSSSCVEKRVGLTGSALGWKLTSAEKHRLNFDENHLKQAPSSSWRVHMEDGGRD
ncbi:hypothetical protein OJAV_G00114750 [Oryzias javanicus]|uniref:Uncharacterized protein n=1 Tax=Oryzias javanicus TaxID=123683 RepID=A0A437CWR4_ORYJA|nr:hypothetical protein OJAV_G00114750 [Oryzias javanicus]